jgi:thiamine-phosphate diphosphorylase
LTGGFYFYGEEGIYMNGRNHFQLHIITDGIKQADELLPVVAAAAKGGADYIQLRYKSAPALDLYTLGRTLQPVLRETGTGLLINDRVDVAQALGADGIHLAAKSLPVHHVRPLVGEKMLVGCSVHSVEEALEAEKQGASYITYGHIFATHSKPGLPPRGIASLQQVVDAVSLPVLAIGGITHENIDQVLSTGVAGIAVIGAVMSQNDPYEAARMLRQRLDESPYAPKHPLPAPRP